MTQNDDLPACVRPDDDIEFLVNEYLTRRGYYGDLNRLKSENQSLRRELVNIDKEVHKLRKCLVSQDVSVVWSL
jgi:hypothetical protein